METFLKNKRNISWLVLIFVFSFIIYSNTFKNDFIAGDEQNIILNNSYLRDWKYFYKFFTENLTAGSGILYNYWRPFQLMVYSLIVHTVGIKPWAFHFSSIFFHSLCGVLIFIFFTKLTQKSVHPAIIAAATLMWAAHPIHNEELSLTTGIASPGHLFWILLGVISFLIFEERKKKGWYLLSLLSFVFALFSKESAIVFPGLLLGAHITCIKTGLTGKMKVKDFLYRHAPFWITALAYVASRLTILNFGNTLNFYKESNIFTQSLLYRIYTLFTVLAQGLRIIFFPYGLHPERSWPVFTNFFSWQVIASFLILAAIIILAVISWKKNPLFSFGVFWFFFAYLPMSNLFTQINALVWDHWFYTPSVGIFLCLISLVSLLKNHSYQKYSLYLLVPAALFLGVLTFLRNPYWKNTESLSRFILAYEPDNARVWNNLGMSLAERGEDKRAIVCYREAIRLGDIYPQTHHNLGNIYFNLGRLDLAEMEFLKAIEMDNKFHYSYLSLGRLYLSLGRKDEAVIYFKKALEIYPYLPHETVEFIENMGK